jgi:hypothetical protein
MQDKVFVCYIVFAEIVFGKKNPSMVYHFHHCQAEAELVIHDDCCASIYQLLNNNILC